MCGEGHDARVRHVLAATQIDALQTLGGGGESDDGSVAGVDNAGQIDGDETRTGCQHTGEGVVGKRGAPDERKTLETVTHRQAGEMRVGDVRTEKKEIETTDKSRIGEGLVVAAGEDVNHLDERRQLGDAGFVPQQLDGALAPGSAHQERVAQIAGAVQVLEDVDQDLWRQVGDG